MKGEVDRGIVDQSAVGMRVATFSAGIWLTYVVCVTSAIYARLTCGLPPRLPRERIVRSRFREIFFRGWSLLDLVLIVLATWADGGTGSPLALSFFIPVVFAAMSYPLGSVLAVGGLSVAAYMGLAVTIGGAGWAYQGLFAVML